MPRKNPLRRPFSRGNHLFVSNSLRESEKIRRYVFATLRLNVPEPFDQAQGERKSMRRPLVLSGSLFATNSN
jgi:hypothetical protein